MRIYEFTLSVSAFNPIFVAHLFFKISTKLVFFNVSKYVFTAFVDIILSSYIEYKSTAIPKCHVKSGLFVSHLLSTSITSESNHGYLSVNGVHRSASEISSKSLSNSQIQGLSVSSGIHNSFFEQIIPFDSTPRSFLGAIVIPASSNTAHSNAATI
jgi:hypothetical protein